MRRPNTPILSGPDASRNNYPWVPLVSSNLRAACYWRDLSGDWSLDIRFKGGRIYRYFGVPESVFHALLVAPSKGKYHAKAIKWSYFYDEL